MTGVLLDSHVVLWTVAAPDRLGPDAVGLLRSTSARYVSSITHVEFQIKAGLGKISLPPRFAELVTDQGMTPLPFTERHAVALADLPGHLVRHDPFDRMLLAQAAAEGLVFVTADSRLLDSGVDRVVDARH